MKLHYFHVTINTNYQCSLVAWWLAFSVLIQNIQFRWRYGQHKILMKQYVRAIIGEAWKNNRNGQSRQWLSVFVFCFCFFSTKETLKTIIGTHLKFAEMSGKHPMCAYVYNYVYGVWVHSFVSVNVPVHSCEEPSGNCFVSCSIAHFLIYVTQIFHLT